jgi:hypothetical protein
MVAGNFYAGITLLMHLAKCNCVKFLTEIMANPSSSNLVMRKKWFLGFRDVTAFSAQLLQTLKMLSKLAKSVVLGKCVWKISGWS